MPSNYTPLRYPGGKSKMSGYLASIIAANGLTDCAYAEPFAGGAGAGLALLYEGWADHFYLNDIDRAVISFWRAATRHAEAFAKRIERVPLTVAEWDRQKKIYREARMGFDLGFAFFYLNRTNRSGIMNAGPIGGRDQTGSYKIDARFNRDELAERVRTLGGFKERITITRLDALVFLSRLPATRKVFTYLDPPYYMKGQDLYTNFYAPTDHADIAQALKRFRHPWLMTYDACEEIRALYSARTVLNCELSYSAREVRRGEELVIFGPNVRRPRGNQKLLANRRAGFEVIS